MPLFSIKAQFKVQKSDAAPVRLGKNVMAGGCAGTASLCFVYSLDYARTRLANDVKSVKKGGAVERQYSGLFDVYKQTLKTDGIGGLYRGFVISAVGIFVYRGFYFGLYDTVRPMMPEGAGPLTSFCLGYAVTGWHSLSILLSLSIYTLGCCSGNVPCVFGGIAAISWCPSIPTLGDLLYWVLSVKVNKTRESEIS